MAFPTPLTVQGGWGRGEGGYAVKAKWPTGYKYVGHLKATVDR